jgi:hypothetical protein
MIMKIGCYFSKIVPGESSWPLGPKGKLLFVREKNKLGPP